MVDAGTTSRRPERTNIDEARLKLSRTAALQIRRHAETGYPEEICGGLLGRWAADGTVAVVRATPTANRRAEGRERRYLIGPDEVRDLERQADESGLQVVGYYHSHPDAPPTPSEFDREQAWPWYAYLIIAVSRGRAGEAKAWRLSDDRERFEAVDIGALREAGERHD